MEKIVALCKRRGFVFQSSEIYGGLNGFWDYGPLGVELKRNVKEAWWRDMITSHDEFSVPAGAPSAFSMVGLDCSLIMHPQVWKCSGHYDLFHDMMSDCRETKRRFRFDQIRGRWVKGARDPKGRPRVYIMTDADTPEAGLEDTVVRACKFFDLRRKDAETGLTFETAGMVGLSPRDDLSLVLVPGAGEAGTLTPPREFNLMFKTTIGALGGADDAAFLRPETAQGMFVNFKNVLDTQRVRVPFGIAQMGKSFRNEITPRNFTFRSREFEQMEMEFFCHPDQSRAWYRYWRDRRWKWYLD
ncbi:MAG: glycine--tRNA ligase, partial [Planctomycetaceae bacterium]